MTNPLSLLCSLRGIALAMCMALVACSSPSDDDVGLDIGSLDTASEAENGGSADTLDLTGGEAADSNSEATATDSLPSETAHPQDTATPDTAVVPDSSVDGGLADFHDTGPAPCSTSQECPVGLLCAAGLCELCSTGESGDQDCATAYAEGYLCQSNGTCAPPACFSGADCLLLNQVCNTTYHQCMPCGSSYDCLAD